MQDVPDGGALMDTGAQLAELVPDLPETPPPLAHGGDLAAARRMFPGAPEPLLDLSTGINPHGYPMPALKPEVFGRLPAPDALARLALLAAHVYGAPDAACVTPAPGTQILLPRLAASLPPGEARVLAPTYAEHARAAALTGHHVAEAATLEELAGADLAIVVNPNNPDGRMLDQSVLGELLTQRQRNPALRRGLMVVDEAFMDAVPGPQSLAARAGEPGLAVLRSFGKFHGLAGVRLGFLLAHPALATRIAAEFGPWAVSGPALAAGTKALADSGWAEHMRAMLATEARRLDAVLARNGLRLIGGTPLFRLVDHPRARALFEHLGRAGILVRRFDHQPTRLRLGLPGSEPGWQRLESALACAKV